MCRLIVVRSRFPVSAASLLLDAPCSLRRQSCRDRQGERHGDGWGIGSYSQGAPSVVRRATAADADPEFAAAAQVESPLIVGHVRQASVGANSAENCHPFTFGRWTFAHNGTIQAFAAVRPRLLAETSPRLAAARHGETDSEHAFLWLLSRLERIGVDLESGVDGVAPLEDLLSRAIPELAGWSDAERPEEPPRLNFMLTDGRFLAVSRWGHSLWQRRTDAGGAPIAAIASEPVHHPADVEFPGWEEIPDRTIAAVDDKVELSLHPI